jgi:hypothetical protein
MNNFNELCELLVTEAPLSDYIAAARQKLGYGAPGYKTGLFGKAVSGLGNVAGKAISGAGSLASKAVGAAGYGLGANGKSLPGTGALQAGITTAANIGGSAVAKTAGAIGAGIQGIANLKQDIAELQQQRMYRDRDPKPGEVIGVDIKTQNNQQLFPITDYKIQNVPKIGTARYVDITMPNSYSLRAELPVKGEFSNVFVFQNGRPLRDPQYVGLGANLYYSQNEKKWKLSSSQRLPAYIQVPRANIPAGNLKQGDAITIKDAQGRVITGQFGGFAKDNKNNDIATILDPEYK